MVFSVVPCAVLVCASALIVDVVFTSAVPFSIRAVTAAAALNFPGTVRIAEVTSPDEVHPDGEAVLDYSYREDISRTLERENGERTYRRMWPSALTTDYGDAVTSYLSLLNFRKVLIVADTHNLHIAHYLLSTYPAVYREIAAIPSMANYSFALQFIGRVVKPRGIDLLAIFADEEATVNILRALEDKKLNRAGYGFVLSQEAAKYRFSLHNDTGLLASGLLFVDEDCGTRSSRESYEQCRLMVQLRTIQSEEEVSPAFTLFSLSHGEAIAVHFPLRQSILFPGNSTTIPSETIAKIRASVNYQVLNANGSPYPPGAQWMRGYQVAFKEVNTRTDIAPDYLFEDSPVVFTTLAFNYNSSKAAVSTVGKDLGLIYISIPSTACIAGMSRVFADLNLRMPMVGGSIGSVLSDPKAFPYYLRPRVANRYMFTIICRLIAYFGWSKVAAVYERDAGDYEDGYQRFAEIAPLFGINITNPEESRGLPSLLNANTTGLVNHTLTRILQSHTRIVLVMHRYIHLIMDQMYDLGVREEYVILTVTGLSDSIYRDPSNYKRRVVSKGALMFFPNVFVGAVGQRVWKALVAIDGEKVFQNTCFFYDAAYLYFHATDFLLEQGLDYEDGDLIVHTMRETYFAGCGGLFRIESGSNDHTPSEINIMNFQYDSSNDTYALRIVGSYNPYSAQPYKFFSQVQWPDNQPTYADEKPRYKDCPFLLETVRTTPQGAAIAVAVNLGVVGLTLAVSVIVWKRKWRTSIVVLTEKQPITIEDVLALSTVLCDFFQFACVGPDLSPLSHQLATLSSTFGFRLEELLGVNSSTYWAALDAVLVLVVLWVTVALLRLTGTDAAIARICSSFEYWTELLMPTLGSLLFLPIVSTLSSVFLCYRGTSDLLTDTFLDKDCREYCWRGKHLVYAVGSGLALLCYLPLALFTRPLWQDLQANLHVKSRPSALAVKSAAQVLLIVSANTFRKQDSIAHTIVFLCIVTVHMVYMCVLRQSNYDRLNLWQVLATLGLLILCSSAEIAGRVHGYSSYCVAGTVIAWGVLGGVGFLLQWTVPKFGSRLERERSRDVRGLFTFAFTTGQRAKEGLDHFYTANSVSGTWKKGDNSKK